jgi:fatty-acid desaturase
MHISQTSWSDEANSDCPVADGPTSPPQLASPLQQGRVHWQPGHVALVLGMHGLALLALIPWLFSWTGVVLAVAGAYLFGMFGPIIGFHRLLTHRSFKCPKWLEYGMALVGVCCVQGSPIRWVTWHRMHHQHSDMEEDPHSPLVSFIWAHLEWMLTEDKKRSWFAAYDKYAPDMIRDRFYLMLERKGTWFFVYIAHTMLYFAVGFAVGSLRPAGTMMGGLQFGLSLLVWGAYVRTVLVWHITWSVNSFSHVSGYRNYETLDQSRNNWFVSLIASGEGWHNNHHAQPNAASSGHRWWEFDPAYQLIRAMSMIGLVSDIVPVRGQLLRLYDGRHEQRPEGNRTELKMAQADPHTHWEKRAA